MKLKNNIIIALVQAGCLALTAEAIDDASQGYKVIKFRRGVQKAFEGLQDAERAIINDCHLEIVEKGVLNGEDADKEKFAKLRNELYNDETEIGEVKALPYTAWHELKKACKGLAEPYIEDNLEGVLWVAPEE